MTYLVLPPTDAYEQAYTKAKNAGLTDEQAITVAQNVEDKIHLQFITDPTTGQLIDTSSLPKGIPYPGFDPTQSPLDPHYDPSGQFADQTYEQWLRSQELRKSRLDMISGTIGGEPSPPGEPSPEPQTDIDKFLDYLKQTAPQQSYPEPSIPEETKVKFSDIEMLAVKYNDPNLWALRHFPKQQVLEIYIHQWRIANSLRREYEIQPTNNDKRHRRRR